jgi:hypothetical protein
LADLVRKLGERVLPEIIPILEKGLDSPHSDQRQGVCIGLSEIMTACSRDYVRINCSVSSFSSEEKVSDFFSHVGRHIFHRSRSSWSLYILRFRLIMVCTHN